MPIGFLTRAMKRKVEDPEPETGDPEVKGRPIEYHSASRVVGRPRKRARTYSTPHDTKWTGGRPIDDFSPQKAGDSSKTATATLGVAKEDSGTGGEEDTADGATLVEELTQTTVVNEASQSDTIYITVADASTQVDATMLAPVPPPPVYTFDEKYNFEDGDIILRVASTLFRIHTSRLEDVEGLFGQLLSLPQPEDGEKIEGVMVCDLYDLVTPSEFHYLLAVIYGDM